MNKLLASVLNTVFSSYFENFSSDALNLSLLSSKIELNNLSFYKFSLLQHNLPFIIEQSVIRSFTANIPWYNFFNSPVNCCISDVQVLISSLLSKDSKYPNKDKLQEIRAHQLEAHEQFKSTSKLLLKIVSSSFISSLLTKIMSKILITIDRVNIRFEFDNYSIGLLIKNLSITEPLGISDNLVDRKITVSDMSIYIDSINKRIKETDLFMFIQIMNNFFAEDHSFIIKNFSIDGRLVYNKQIDIILSTLMCKINVKLSQTEFLMESLSLIPNFISYLNSRDKKVDGEKSPSELWIYAHSCASDHSSLLRNIKNNLEYLRHWKEDNTENDIINRLDNSLEYYTIIFLRNLLVYKEDISFPNYDAQVFISDLLRSVNFYFSSNVIEINVEKYLLILNSFALKKINNKGTCTMSLSFSSFQVKLQEDGAYYTLIESAERNTVDFDIKMNIPSILSKKASDITFNMDASVLKCNLLLLEKVKLSQNLFDSVICILRFLQRFRIPYFSTTFVTNDIEILLYKSTDSCLKLYIKSIDIRNSDYLRGNITGGTITFNDEPDTLFIDNININVTTTDSNIKTVFDEPKVNFNIASLKKIIEIIPEIHLIDDISFESFLIFESYIPEFSISIFIPNFILRARFPLTKDPTNINVSPTSLDFKLSKNCRKIKNLSFKFDFQGIKSDGEILNLL